MARIGFTEHAVDRFIQRHAPEMTREEARLYLTTVAQNAVRLKEKSVGGQVQWHIPESRIVLVTKPDGQEQVCVTILPHQRHSEQPTDEEMEEILRLEREYALSNKMLRESEPIEKLPRAQPPQKSQEETNSSSVQLYALDRKSLSKILHLRAFELTKKKQEEKTKRHFDHQNKELEKIRKALRASLRYVRKMMPDPNAVRVWEEVADVDAGLISNDFLTQNGRLPPP